MEPPPAALPAAVPIRVIIDTDPGIDDVMALLLALASPELKVEGLTINMGNHEDIPMLARNACLALELAGAHGVPVLQGAAEPLKPPFHGHSGILVHGENGLGGVPFPLQPSLAPLSMHKGTHAAQFIVDTCRGSPGEVLLICLAPLTNIGLALRLCPELPDLVRGVVLMGGTADGRGNKTPAAEANVHNDPEAARAVFRSFRDITMAGLNVTRQVPLAPTFRTRIRACGFLGEYIYLITQHYVDLLRSWGHSEEEIGVHDATAIMAVLRPELFTRQRATVDVEVEGELARGATVVSWKGHWKHLGPQTEVLMAVDVAQYQECYLQRIAALSAARADSTAARAVAQLVERWVREREAVPAA